MPTRKTPRSSGPSDGDALQSDATMGDVPAPADDEPTSDVAPAVDADEPNDTAKSGESRGRRRGSASDWVVGLLAALAILTVIQLGVAFYTLRSLHGVERGAALQHCLYAVQLDPTAQTNPDASRTAAKRCLDDFAP